MTEIELAQPEIEKKIKNVRSLKELEELKIEYLGRQGLINKLLKQITQVPDKEKKTFGQKINHLKIWINEQIVAKYKQLVEQTKNVTPLDLTLPGKAYPRGSLHVLTYAIEEITEIFEKIGFIKMSYPEVEWDYFAFEALNMPKDHPARDDFETFFVEAPLDKKMGKMVLTPHTSSGQVREMLRVSQDLSSGKQAPIRMINISKCYRPNYDATHTPMFFQFEGLCVDQGINISHLKGTIEYFVKEYFGSDRTIRLRPFHFQFTEPSFEVDVSCEICQGKGEINNKKCKVCKTGWLELGGTGMVHPNVLKAGKIDPTIYTGWAFGFGIERVIMMKYKIEDIRNYYAGDIRFLEQF